MRLVILFLMLAPIAAQAEQDWSAHAGKRIERIEFELIQRSDSATLLAEMDSRPGTRFGPTVFEADLQRLRNWQIFNSVEGRVEPTGDGLVLYVAIDEKWTIQPVLRFQEGGGTMQAKVGIRETHLLGRHQEVALYSGWRGSEVLYGGWFEEPRILGTWLGFRLDAGREFIEDPVYPFKGTEPLFVATIDHRFANTDLYYRLGDTLRFGWRHWLAWQGFEISEESPEGPDGDPLRPELLEPDKRVSRAEIYGEWGITNYDDFQLGGWLVGLHASRADEAWGSETDYNRYEIDLRGYLPVGSRHTAAARVMAGWTNAEPGSEQFMLGGFDNLRGFFDRQFRGTRYWLLNTDFRLLFIKHPWLYVQANALFDAGRVWSGEVAQDDASEDVEASAGGGLRFILPWMHEGSFRVDLAWPLTRSQGPSTTMGIEQFF